MTASPHSSAKKLYVLTLNLEHMTEQKIRDQLREHDCELPDNFDFRQHVSLTIDVKKKKIIGVEKIFVPDVR